MKPNTPFLAIPIKAQVSSDGLLLSADPQLWRMQILASGTEGGPLAIPGLAAIAALAQRTRMRIEKPVRAADEDNDVELWVVATPQDDMVELSVLGWRDIIAPSETVQAYESVEHFAADENLILIDAQQRIVRLPAILPRNAVGEHLGQVFVFDCDDDNRIPLIDALVEQRDISGMSVGLVGQEGRYILELTRQFAANGTYLGHVGQITPIQSVDPNIENAALNTELSMGRQFASVLKLPLSRIVANAETIGSRLHGPLRDDYAEYANDIANAARHLAELVSDMEDLEAIDRPDFSVSRDKIELGDIARRVCGLLALKASDHGITLSVPGRDQKIPAIGEFRRVLQILLNLVGNAIRYAPHGSTVTISVEREAEIAAITVADQGSGVPEADRERVFEKFERLGRSGDGGSGLGLYISRKLARAMDGELTVSAAENGGALFRLTLPID